MTKPKTRVALERTIDEQHVVTVTLTRELDEAYGRVRDLEKRNRELETVNTQLESAIQTLREDRRRLEGYIERVREEERKHTVHAAGDTAVNMALDPDLLRQPDLRGR